MCVEVPKYAKIYKDVIAYKLFMRNSYPLCFSADGSPEDKGTRYKVDIKYTSKRGPGFQAFEFLENAEIAKKDFPGSVIRKVILYKARKGSIKNMSDNSDYRFGWVAKHMMLVRNGLIK